jgi:hypothetical protein
MVKGGSQERVVGGGLWWWWWWWWRPYRGRRPEEVGRWSKGCSNS